MIFFAGKMVPQFVEITKNEWFGEIIWDKGMPGLGYHVRYAHDSIAVLKIGSPVRPINAIMSVIRHPAPGNHHIHEKPVPVLKKLIEWGCPQGGTVLDPFMGCGSTLRAAKDLGRKAIGIEIEPQYCQEAVKIMSQLVLI